MRSNSQDAKVVLHLFLLLGLAGCSQTDPGSATASDGPTGAPWRDGDSHDASASVDAADSGGPTECRADGACLLFRPTGNDSAQNPAYSPDGTRLVITIWHGGYNGAPAG